MATIALVDDEDRIRRSVKRMIEYGGHHTVIDFGDVTSALASIDTTKTDLIVTDLQMKTSGEVLVTALRNGGVQIPILIITGQIAYTDVNHLLGIGVQSVLFKPFTLSELHEEMDKCLGSYEPS